MTRFSFLLAGLAAGCLALKDRPTSDEGCSPYLWDSDFKECKDYCLDDDDCVDGYFCCDYEDYDDYYGPPSCNESQEDSCLPIR